jgi:hypothetical protein
MRNTLQYPITTNEVVSELQVLHDDAMAEMVAEISMGDMRPLLLSTAIQIVQAHGDEFLAKKF